MIDLYMRSVKHKVVGGFARWVAMYTGPMAITMVSLAIGIAAAVTSAFAFAPLSLGLWFLNRFTDGLDGEVARIRNEASDLGGYIDMMSDVVVYAAVPIGVAIAQNDPTTTFVLLLMVASFYLNISSWTYLSALLEKRRAASEAHETAIVMPKGLIEGTETIILYALLIIAPGLTVAVATVAAVGAVIGALQRVLWAVQHIPRRLRRTCRVAKGAKGDGAASGDGASP